VINKTYDTEDYWDKVAQEINARQGIKAIAGDDEPYYRYKRKLFLKLFDTIDFSKKSVLEVGSGPGANLDYLSIKGCKELTGVDISIEMIELSKKLLQKTGIQVIKINGGKIPFGTDHFDIVFTSTVLQHNTDEIKLKELIMDICRVSKSDVIIFERIEKKIKGHESNLGRPVEYYESLFKENNFTLTNTSFIKIQASYFVCGVIRKLFNRRKRKEGEPISGISRTLQTITLPFSKILDKITPSNRDLGMLYFKKNIS
jgi:SAM-dependent methyltransferase